jgi:stage V sporulation protein SpoVS
MLAADAVDAIAIARSRVNNNGRICLTIKPPLLVEHVATDSRRNCIRIHLVVKNRARRYNKSQQRLVKPVITHM